MEKRLSFHTLYLYVENGLKNNSGGAAHLKVANKVVEQHADMSLGPRCHVPLLDLYRSKLPPGYTQDAFYFRPLLSSSPDGPWFSKQVYGHNKLCTTLKEMRLEAGIPVRSIYALRATAASRLFQSDVPEHMIQERTGHRSLKALRAYSATTHPCPFL